MTAIARNFPGVSFRDATEDDLPAIAALYGHHVIHGLGTFEETPPDMAEMTRRRDRVLQNGLPFLVAELDGAVRGYAYALPYRERSAYRYTVEDSIYVADGWGARGIGRVLLAALIEGCERAGKRQMVSVIGDSANVGSITLHARLGFRFAGVLPSAGFKHGRWVDSVIMQRPLGDGDTTPPDA